MFRAFVEFASLKNLLLIAIEKPEASEALAERTIVDADLNYSDNCSWWVDHCLFRYAFFGCKVLLPAVRQNEVEVPLAGGVANPLNLQVIAAFDLIVRFKEVKTRRIGVAENHSWSQPQIFKVKTLFLLYPCTHTLFFYYRSSHHTIFIVNLLT
jgi:hypothetical protein